MSNSMLSKHVGYGCFVVLAILSTGAIAQAGDLRPEHNAELSLLIHEAKLSPDLYSPDLVSCGAAETFILDNDNVFWHLKDNYDRRISKFTQENSNAFDFLMVPMALADKLFGTGDADTRRYNELPLAQRNGFEKLDKLLFQARQTYAQSTNVSDEHERKILIWETLTLFKKMRTVCDQMESDRRSENDPATTNGQISVQKVLEDRHRQSDPDQSDAGKAVAAH